MGQTLSFGDLPQLSLASNFSTSPDVDALALELSLTGALDCALLQSKRPIFRLNFH